MELAKANQVGFSDDEDDDGDGDDAVDDARASEHSYELYVQSGRPGEQDDNKERMSVYSSVEDPLALHHRARAAPGDDEEEAEDDARQRRVRKKQIGGSFFSLRAERIRR